MVKGLYEKYAVRISDALTILKDIDGTNHLLKLVNIDLKNNVLSYNFKEPLYRIGDID